MREWWQKCSAREQLSLALLAGTVVIFMLFTLGVQPLWQSLQQKRQALLQDVQLLQWMVPQVEKIAQLRKRTQGFEALSSSRLLPQVEQSLKASSFAQGVKQISLAGNETVSVSLQAIPFDDFMAWLIQQKRQHGIVVKTLSVTRLDAPGVVRVEARLGA